jgi:di/tricarboxylate transporter
MPSTIGSLRCSRVPMLFDPFIWNCCMCVCLCVVVQWILEPSLTLAQAWLGLTLFVKCYAVDKDDAIVSPVQLLNPVKMTPDQLESAIALRAKAAASVPVKTSRSSASGQRLRVGDVHAIGNTVQHWLPICRNRES